MMINEYQEFAQTWIISFLCHNSPREHVLKNGNDPHPMMYTLHLFTLISVLSYRNWYQDFGHCGVTNDLGSSPQPSGFALGLWWASQVVGDTTMTEIEVSISILSWCLKTYWIYTDSGIYKQKIVHKTASNQPLWKAWPQTIVTAASLVTSWLPLWCHSDARVTKSWQYASLKNKQKQ